VIGPEIKSGAPASGARVPAVHDSRPADAYPRTDGNATVNTQASTGKASPHGVQPGTRADDVPMTTSIRGDR